MLAEIPTVFGAYNVEKTGASTSGALKKRGNLTNRLVTRFYVCTKGLLMYYEKQVTSQSWSLLQPF